MDHDSGQDYEEDDLLSFANPHYTGTNSVAKDEMNRGKRSEFDNLLDDCYKELSPSPESSNGALFDLQENDYSRRNFLQDEDDEEISDADEDIYKALDEFYIKVEKNSGERKENNVKRRQYASIRMDDMGINTENSKRDMDASSPKFSEPSSPSDSGRDENLPHGWEKHEDDDGSYYWHIRTGTIQRHPPDNAASDSEHSVFEFPMTSEPITRSGTSCTGPLHFKDEPKRFSVRSLGWTEIEEESLTPEKSSRAVNRCILDLSAGKNDTMDAVGRWGEGKDIFLELYPDKLCLVDAVDSAVLHEQPVQTIRVWGVGRDDNRQRDFAFVARDLQSNTFKCHVLRCDMPARRIAHALKEICQEYIAQHAEHKSGKRTPKRPHTLSLGRRRGSLLTSGNVFPTPTEEPKKIFKISYVGRRPVKVGVGIDVMHSVIEQLRAECPEEEWIPVSVAVSPSTITITTQEQEPEVIAECRVRYLTFLGIGCDDVRTCGFIVHTPEDTFLAHVFACDPSGGPLCKAIEAACKLRYQKFLDAHSKAMEEAQNRRLQTPTDRIGAKLRNFFGSVTNHLRAN